MGTVDKELLVKLLKTMRDVIDERSEKLKRVGCVDIYHSYMGQSIALSEVIWCLRDDEMFKKALEIYGIKEGGNDEKGE